MRTQHSIAVPFRLGSFALFFKVVSAAVFSLASLSLIAYLIVMLGKVAQ
jgi:hypothetical protein